MTVRIQMEFRNGGDGWSEVLYYDAGVPKPVQPQAQLLVNARVKILARTAVIHHVRISAVDGANPSFRFPPTGNTGALPSASTRDAAAIVANVNVYTSTGLRRQLQLHGLPDDYFVWDEKGVYQSQISAAVDTYLTSLKTLNMQIRTVHTRAAAHTAPTIDSITVTNGLVTFTGTFAAMVPGQKWRVSGATGNKARQWNGVWKVGSVTGNPATAFSARTKRLIDPTAGYDAASAQLRLAQGAGYDYFAIDTHDQFDTPGSRRAGRPTDSPRGKSSIRR